MSDVRTVSGFDRYREQFVEFAKDTWFGYLLVAPALIILGIVIGYPIAEALHMSFYERSMLAPNEYTWVGLSNYRELLSDGWFHTALWNTVVLTTAAVSLEFLLGLGLAIVLKQKLPGIRFLRSISMVTWVIPIVVTVIIFNFMLQPEFGLFNIFLEELGLPTRYWFGHPGAALWFIVVMHVWRNVPFFALALLASMLTIPQELYEAARIDGASSLQQFRYITLPNISYTAMIMIVIHVIFTFNNFEFVYLSTGGGPVGSTEVLATYVYKEGFQAHALGYAASVGTVMLVILTVFTAVYVKLEVSE